MKKVYVCSPLAGDADRNIERAKEYCRLVTGKGHLPIASHIYFTQFLDDESPKDRKTGMDMGLELLRLCDEIWVFGDKISVGMTEEINFAKKLSKKIFYKN